MRGRTCSGEPSTGRRASAAATRATSRRSPASSTVPDGQRTGLGRPPAPPPKGERSPYPPPPKVVKPRIDAIGHACPPGPPSHRALPGRCRSGDRGPPGVVDPRIVAIGLMAPPPLGGIRGSPRLGAGEYADHPGSAGESPDPPPPASQLPADRAPCWPEGRPP